MVARSDMPTSLPACIASAVVNDRLDVSQKEFLLFRDAIVLYQLLNAFIAVLKVFVELNG